MIGNAMKALIGVIISLICVVAILVLIVDVLLALGYVVVSLLRIYEKNGNIRSAGDLPEGEIFEKNKKSVKNICEYIEDVIRLYEGTDRKDTRCRVGANLHQRINAVREKLADNSIERRIRFVNVNVENTDKGQNLRRWDQGGKEWRVGEVYAVMTEQYIDKGSGNVLSDNYYPNVRIRFAMSRRLKAEDKAGSAKKDKWGRKIESKEILYENERLKCCPSCGAELLGDLKDVTCPYCNSTIFSDYYDWQIESLEIEPRKMMVRGIIGWLIYYNNHKAIGSGVKNNEKAKVVRFSENDFRQDVYESFLADEKNDNFIDMWLGELDIRKVKNTDKDTLINVKVPVYRVHLEKDSTGKALIRSTKHEERATFTRVRYPDRFRKENAVVSKEKSCPACGGAFAPDDNGNCRFCGTFLFKDNVKWKRI